MNEEKLDEVDKKKNIRNILKGQQGSDLQKYKFQATDSQLVA